MFTGIHHLTVEQCVQAEAAEPVHVLQPGHVHLEDAPVLRHERPVSGAQLTRCDAGARGGARQSRSRVALVQVVGPGREQVQFVPRQFAKSGAVVRGEDAALGQSDAA